MSPFSSSPWFLLCEPKPPRLVWMILLMLAVCCQGQGSASSTKRPEEGRNLFMKVWACLHCSETPNSPFCCFMSVTGIPGRREQGKRNTRSHELRLRSCWHQVHGNVCVPFVSSTSVQRQDLIKTYSSAANSLPSTTNLPSTLGQLVETDSSDLLGSNQ